uniref:Uncharacterized protein n=1 Tax=Klebsiella phage Hope TaxID=3350564 RepID=A0AB74UN90_9CAUD
MNLNLSSVLLLTSYYLLALLRNRPRAFLSPRNV